MNDVVEFLKENPVQYLATIDLEGNPSVCPFQFILEFDGKLWFYTSNEKDVYEHMKKTPNIELCVCNEKAQWIRISGLAVFSDNVNVKEKMIEKSSTVKSIFKNIANPAFEIFYIGNGKATIYDHSEGEPKSYIV